MKKFLIAAAIAQVFLASSLSAWWLDCTAITGVEYRSDGSLGIKVINANNNSESTFFVDSASQYKKEILAIALTAMSASQPAEIDIQNWKVAGIRAKK